MQKKITKINFENATNMKTNGPLLPLLSISFIFQGFLDISFFSSGWGSNFEMTKCRTTDISEFQNCEY